MWKGLEWQTDKNCPSTWFPLAKKSIQLEDRLQRINTSHHTATESKAMVIVSCDTNFMSLHVKHWYTHSSYVDFIVLVGDPENLKLTITLTFNMQVLR